MHKQMKVERWRLRGAAPQEARSERGVTATDAAAINPRTSNREAVAARKAAESSKPREEKRSSGEEKRARR